MVKLSLTRSVLRLHTYQDKRETIYMRLKVRFVCGLRQDARFKRCNVALLISVLSLLLTTSAHSNQTTDNTVAPESETSATSRSEIEPLALQPSAKPQPSANNDSVIEPVRPLVNLDGQLRDDLESQFNLMRARLETEEAFSEALGEDYLNYGLLLKRAGRLDEATEMFTNALHISKINNGVYSTEQRPILRALFDTSYLLGETDLVEGYLNRILWIESKHSGLDDDYSYDLLVKMGNHYVDLFLYKPIGGELGLLYLNSANKYFGYAIKRYDQFPLTTRMLPYGELALVNLLKSKIEVQVQKQPAAPDRSRQQGSAYFEQLRTETYFEESFSRGELYLKKFLKKAKSEDNQELVVQALLNIGDINMLFLRKPSAIHHYQLAWQEAQLLADDHPLVKSFDSPVELPAFKYAYTRHIVKRRDKSVYVPMILNVSKVGKVGKVQPAQVGGDKDELYSKARRVARRLTFRPAIEQGKLIDTQNHQHDVRILVKVKRESQG